MIDKKTIEEAKILAEKEKGKIGPLSDLAYESGVRIAKELNADLAVVQLGLLFMDIKRNQAMKENRVEQHVQMSVEAFEKFVENQKISEEEKNKVINCIEAHHKEVPFSCIEAEIVCNADCYKFLHPRGVLFYIGVMMERTQDFEKALTEVEAKADEKMNNLTLEICKKELEPHYKNFKALFKEAMKK